MRALFLALAFQLLAGCSSDSCRTITADVGALCLPPSAAAGQETVIEVRELCGPGCSHDPNCTAFLRNGQVVLTIEQDLCSEAAFQQCVQIQCVQRVVRCRLPSLAPGDYAIVAPGAPLQLLHVAPGGQAACQFDSPPDGGV